MARPQLRDAADRQDALVAYVGVVADKIGLRDHTFEVVQAELPHGIRATCMPLSGRRYSIITVSQDFYDLTPQEQREAITHEEVHAHLHVLMEHVHGLRPELGRAHFDHLCSTFERDLERVCDALTSVLVTSLPLPTV